MASLLFVSRAWAIPNTALNPHPHDNPGTVDFNTTWIDEPPADPVPDPDSDDPDGTMHQHRDTDDIEGPNGKYIGFSVWDDRFYRVGGDWGHGYMKIDARYEFEAGFGGGDAVAAEKNFNDAVVEWETEVNAFEVNTNGQKIRIRLGFDEVASGAHEIDVLWEDIGAADDFATAFWDPGATDFTFDSDPSIKVTADPGTSIRINGSGDPFTLVARLDNGWHFGGAGAPAGHTVFFDENDQADGLGTTTLNAFSVDFKDYDFYTIALHELGHGFGLDHFGTGIMRIDITSLDFYAIQMPEPLMA